MMAYRRPDGVVPFMLSWITAMFCCAVISVDAAAEDDSFRPPAIATANVPAVPKALAGRLRQYQDVRRAEFAGWAPDGKGMLIATRFGETTQLHRVYAPGGRRDQVTFFDEPVEGRFLPRNENILLVSSSAGGDENFQVHRVVIKPPGVVLLTDGKSRNLLGPVRRHDGAAMIIHNNHRNGRDMDIYLAETDKPGPGRLLLEGDGEKWAAMDWSHDGATLLVSRYVSINESYPALLDVATGKKTDIPIPGGGRAAYGAMVFSKDGKHAYVSCDATSEVRKLARVDLATFDYTWLTESIPWDVTDVEVDPTSGLAAFVVNENGASSLYTLDGDKPRKFDIPMATIGNIAFHPDGKSLGMTLSKPVSPADAYSVELATGKLIRWTYSEVGGLDAQRFVQPAQIKYPTFDDREIPAYYFRPSEASAMKPAPVLIHIHGGPEGQYRPVFSEFDQFLVTEMGIAVVRPNVRGSSGYGKTYVALDNGLKREDSVKDIGALLDWIAGQPELDPSRVAVYGGSYGGYMVLASLTNYPDRIKAGVDVVGIASFQTFLETTSSYRQGLRRAEYGDERDPAMREFFAKIDPIQNVNKIRSALLVAHGRNDPRVPFSQAEAIASAVKASGRDVWTVYADNEGHGFVKKANRDYLNAVVAMFLERHLK